MSYQATPLSFKSLSFGGDELTSTEELYMIDNNTIVFNQDLVGTVQIDYIDKYSAGVYLHLKNGVAVKKTFDISSDPIKEKN